MRTSVYTEQNYGTGAPAQPGMEAIHVAPNVWAVVPPPWFPGAAFRSMDQGRRSFENNFRPVAARASRSHSSRPVISPGRIYLVAVERDIEPPVSFGNSMLQRVRVVLAPNPALVSADAAPVPAQSAPVPSRAVRGEILRDEAGRYYEKIGNFVRELGELGASEEGDLVEVPQPSPANTAKQEPSRKLFPDPGQWRVLRWGEFKALLAGQIAHPDRLRDDHRLPCYVQVVEAADKESVLELAKKVFGDSAIARELLMLSPAAADRLELKDLLPQRPKDESVPRQRGFVLPGDRLFRLRVAVDPTADEVAAEVPLKRSIPERFTTQEFRQTREQVLDEMRTPSGLSSRLAGWTRSLFSHSEFEKWQRSLWGKTQEEQLWAVAPPTGMIQNPAVREWAAATLELAGYDLGSMLREWEIYWRRRA